MLQSTLKLAAVVIGFAVLASVVLDQRDGAAEAPQMQEAPRDMALSSAALRPQASEGQGGQRGLERLRANAQGHFAARLELNGVTLPALVDTGATRLCFSAEDAEQAGIRPLPSDFRYRASTANGEVAVASVIVSHLRLGTIELRDVEAAVFPRGALGQSLLGMSVLKRLASFRFEGDTLLLQQ